MRKLRNKSRKKYIRICKHERNLAKSSRKAKSCPSPKIKKKKEVKIIECFLFCLHIGFFCYNDTRLKYLKKNIKYAIKAKTKKYFNFLLQT